MTRIASATMILANSLWCLFALHSRNTSGGRSDISGKGCPYSSHSERRRHHQTAHGALMAMAIPVQRMSRACRVLQTLAGRHISSRSHSGGNTCNRDHSDRNQSNGWAGDHIARLAKGVWALV